MIAHTVTQQLAVEMFADPGEEMGARSRSGDTMRLSRIDEQAVLLAGTNELIHHLHGVLHVHVVIAGAMRDRHYSMQVFRAVDRRALLISLGILFGQPHVAFRVDGVVILPIGDGCNRESGFDAVRVSHGIERHETAVAPSPPADPVAVKLGKLLERLIERGELVFEFKFTEVVTQRCGELLAARTHAAIVDLKYRDAIAREQLMEQERCPTPAVAHRLAVRTSVRIQKNGDLGRRWVLGLLGQQDLATKHGSIFGLKVNELRLDEVEGGEVTRAPEGLAGWVEIAKR